MAEGTNGRTNMILAKNANLMRLRRNTLKITTSTATTVLLVMIMVCNVSIDFVTAEHERASSKRKIDSNNLYTFGRLVARPSLVKPTNLIHGSRNEKLTTSIDDTISLLRGGSSSGMTAGTTETQKLNANPIRVAYQGEPGAYSEKSLRELLGNKVVSVGRQNFESCFRAVANHECDYACLPIENSLGGSIHENYDLMLRYDLTIVAEHEFRVHHCLLVSSDKVKREDIKYAISHPQALAQCDNYLRSYGITPIPTYDTAGSAKMISENSSSMPDKCTPANTAAIASDLAGKTYGLHCLDTCIEDDDTNFTRFLLLGRKSVVQFLSKKIPSKTSIVFTLPNAKGALYKALACFSLRDIDFSKIESRPTSASLLNFLKFKSQQLGTNNSRSRQMSARSDLPRFRYCFYLDFLESELDENARNALSHLREQADFVRMLGSYPSRSRLVGDVHDAVQELRYTADPVNPLDVTLTSLPSDDQEEQSKPLKIGIVGFGMFGQFIAQKFKNLNHKVSCIDKIDKSQEATKLGVDECYQNYEMSTFLSSLGGDLDVIVIAVPMIEFENIISSLPKDKLRGKLIVATNPLMSYPKSILLRHFESVPDVDIICSHPMFGPSPPLSNVASSSSSSSWDGRPMVYEKVRINNVMRCTKFLDIFERSRCQMVEMTAEQSDASTSDAEFVTHLTGRILGSENGLLPPTPVASKEYAALRDVADMTSTDTFDLFFGMFRYNNRAKSYLNKMRDNLAKIERELAAKDAYLAASAEMKNVDRQSLIAECKLLLQEVIKDGSLATETSSKTTPLSSPASSLSATSPKSDVASTQKPLFSSSSSAPNKK